MKLGSAYKKEKNMNYISTILQSLWDNYECLKPGIIFLNYDISYSNEYSDSNSGNDLLINQKDIKESPIDLMTQFIIENIYNKIFPMIIPDLDTESKEFENFSSDEWGMMFASRAIFLAMFYNGEEFSRITGLKYEYTTFKNKYERNELYDIDGVLTNTSQDYLLKLSVLRLLSIHMLPELHSFEEYKKYIDEHLEKISKYKNIILVYEETIYPILVDNQFSEIALDMFATFNLDNITAKPNPDYKASIKIREKEDEIRYCIKWVLKENK